MSYRPKTALLLVNLGTPDSPHPSEVRPYLRQFLSDERVLDIPTLPRQLLLNFVILPTRPRKSGEAYAKIWTEHGSPLLVYSNDLVAKVRHRLNMSVVVEVAMRYGEPSIASALDRLRAASIDRIVVFPLYPQYSSAATGSSIEAVLSIIGARWNTPFVQVIPPFYDHPAFIDAYASLAHPILASTSAERVLFSYHGLPERHLHKSDDMPGQCLASDHCCDHIHDGNRNCYRAHCHATTKALGDALQIAESQRITCFQSRLGRTPWIGPHTDKLLLSLAGDGVKRIAVLTPAFVTDCLETLEEIGIRGRRDWEAAGGESFALVPCLNACDRWVDALLTIVRDHSKWI